MEVDIAIKMEFLQKLFSSLFLTSVTFFIKEGSQAYIFRTCGVNMNNQCSWNCFSLPWPDANLIVYMRNLIYFRCSHKSKIYFNLLLYIWTKHQNKWMKRYRNKNTVFPLFYSLKVFRQSVCAWFLIAIVAWNYFLSVLNFKEMCRFKDTKTFWILEWLLTDGHNF